MPFLIVTGPSARKKSKQPKDTKKKAKAKKPKLKAGQSSKRKKASSVSVALCCRARTCVVCAIPAQFHGSF